MTRPANGEAGGARHRDLRKSRTHTSIVAAGYVNTGIVLVDLLATAAHGLSTSGPACGFRRCACLGTPHHQVVLARLVVRVALRCQSPASLI
jgi:hypothetical protein